MMERLARALTRPGVAWAVIALSLAATAALGFAGRKVGQDDDLLAFLPRGNRDVARFNDVNNRFGGLDVALVGIEVDDPFAPEFLKRLQTLTTRLDQEPQIASALSLANVEDYEPNEEGGVTTKFLTRPLPDSDAAREALRARTMSLDHIVGQLIGPDGRSVIVYNFLDPGADPRATSALIRARVAEQFSEPDTRIYWGGGPFISAYIYDTTRADMGRLLPWAVGLVVLIMLLSFRDPVGAGLALGATVMGIAATYGAMGLAGVDANIVLSSMPVILFAVGSAYAIHVLVRYYALRREHEAEKALVATLVQIGPTVLAAGLTTVAGLLSFTAMDIEPMRQFGLFTALGIAMSLLLSLTFVPAVIWVAGLRARQLEAKGRGPWLAMLVAAAQRRRRSVTLGLGVLVASGAALSARVEARMESAAFFADGSPPAEANAFLSERFGGSTFLQVMVEGDMNDPGVLREVQRLADRIALEPHVSGVNHVAQVLSLVYDAMAGERRVPPTTARVRVLYRFLAGSPALRQLLTEDRQRALIVAKLDTDAHDVVAPLLARVEALAEDMELSRYRVVGRRAAAAQGDGAVDEVVPVAAADVAALRARRLDLVRVRMKVILAGYGVTPVDEAALRASLAAEVETPDVRLVATALRDFLVSDESILTPAQHAQAPGVATAVASLGPKPSAADLEAATAGAIETDDKELAADLAASLVAPLAGIRRRLRAERRADAVMAAVEVNVADDARGRLHGRLREAALDLELPSALLPTEAEGQTLAASVSGTPVLYRGMSESVTANQFKSLALALALVLLIMVALFRSVTAGLLAVAPTVVTLVVVYGVMGARGVFLDIGTSMLASIVIGAGVDYAVHLLAAWRGDSLEEAGATATGKTGAAIWTNAAMVACGFFVLTLGEAKPLENVGGLTASAMIIAAVATFVAIPALARRRHYGTSGPGDSR
ncbi:MAG: MMPL family transporter [Myxococcota bacterium]